MSFERARAPLLLFFAVVAVWGGQELRARLGFSLSSESLQAWVAGFGWKAPVVYLAALTFRPFLLVPSFVLLPAGGLCFGVIAGTMLGAAGVSLSAVIQYGLAHGIGRERIRRRFGDSVGRVRQQIETAGPLAVGLVTAHPTGPMTAFHWGAALASVPFVPFLVAVSLGSFTRSFLYSFFGASLSEGASLRFYFAVALLFVFILLPIAHPEVRSRLRGQARPDS